jgi:cytochrome c biogenesis protein CcmG/thiol:disulfide interchange protein DsbE
MSLCASLTALSSATSSVRGGIAVVVALAAVVACDACGGGLETSPPGEGPSAGLVGDQAPNFTVQTIAGSGAALSLRELRGTVVLVDFWATYCAPCKRSLPKLDALRAKYAGRGLHVVGISEDEPDDRDKIAEFASAHGARFAIAWDEDKSIARHYKPETMPSTFVIDRKGIVRFVHVGYRDGDEGAIEKEVTDLLAE